MSVETADGVRVTIRFDGSRCIHARRCVIGAPAVFRANVEGPWIDPDAEDVEAVMRIALACPSGAISVARKDGGADETSPRVNTVTVRENGPLAVHADLDLKGHGQMTRATLCRCGLSRNKPFCDNSHIKGGFVATGEPETRPSDLAIPDLVGPLAIAPQPDGPLIATGRFELESGAGRNVDRPAKAALCRCGQSAHKPFCDGSHKRAGFAAP